MGSAASAFGVAVLLAERVVVDGPVAAVVETEGGRAVFGCVVPDDRAAAVLAGVQHLLADRPGVMFVSDTSVSRPEYFR